MYTELLHCQKVSLSVLLPPDQHEIMFLYAGFSNSRQYRYWDPVTKGVDFDGMIEDLREAPAHSVIVLHACAHNPTGCDLTKEQWIKVADVVQVRRPRVFKLIFPCLCRQICKPNCFCLCSEG